MKRFAFIIVLLLLPAMLFAHNTTDNKPDSLITDAIVTGNMHWTNDYNYILTEGCFLEDGGVLVIDSGTVIKGQFGTGVNSCFLCICRGAQIFANGTENYPIIFTGSTDDIDDPFDIPFGTNGLWGGLLILGNATIADPAGENHIEGIPSEEPRGFYGGNDDDDNSGVIRYVSLRHGGTEIGGGNEINGVSLGGVGRGTTMEYVEVFNNYDDGFEFFGGTVNTKYLVSAFNGDDAFDYDEGFRGHAQYWFCIQDSANGNRGGEHDGAVSPEDQTPFAIPVIYNATYIGSGTATDNIDNDLTIIFRDNAGGEYYNSIFTEFLGQAIQVEDLAPGNVDSRNRLEAGDLVVQHNFFYDYGAWDGTAASIFPQDFVENYMTDAGNNNHINVAPNLILIDRHDNSAKLDPRLRDNSVANTPGEAELNDGFFDDVDYHGAFPAYDGSKAFEGGLWIHNWTYIDERNILADNYVPTTTDNKPDSLITDAIVTGTMHWTNDYNYILTEGCFLEDGGVLTIDSGTVIKGQFGTGVNSCFLCICRGAQIFANGTENYPIIFTGSTDDIDDPFDIPFGTNGLWGGLLILGNATIADPAGENHIEGIPSEEPRGFYGGNDDDDNSGVIRYVSLRHGGTEIGGGNEINGVSLGGVGRGTTMEYVEVFNNYDDGFEFFGGTVNTKYLVSAFNGDDAFDYDEGFRGHAQYWFCIQDSANGNRGGEHDGAVSPEDQTPFAIPVIYNATYIGSGTATDNIDNDLTIIFRDNAGGEYYNSIFTEFLGQAIQVEDLAPGNVDSRNRLEAGDLIVQHNFFYDYGAWDGTAASIFPQDFVENYMTDGVNNNHINSNPNIISVDRHDNGALLDPRIRVSSSANAAGANELADGFFEDVDYHGAFPAYDGSKALSDGLWIANWTYIQQRNILADHFVQPDCQGECGDANLDTKVNVSDAVYLINYVFSGGNEPQPVKACGDVNSDEKVNVSDAVYLINYVFSGGNPPGLCSPGFFPGGDCCEFVQDK